MSNPQVKSTEVLCSVVVSVAQEKCPDMLCHVREVYLHFKTAIGLFGKCHNIYNGGVLTVTLMSLVSQNGTSINVCEQVGISLVGFSTEKDIAAFMAFYRQTFPTATILPKMHLLEDHVIPWMRRWHIGAGLMGEQRAESIHAHFNRIEMQYNGIVSPLDRLMSSMSTT